MKSLKKFFGKGFIIPRPLKFLKPLRNIFHGIKNIRLLKKLLPL